MHQAIQILILEPSMNMNPHIMCHANDFDQHFYAFLSYLSQLRYYKSSIRETLNLSACADSSTDTKKTQNKSGNLSNQFFNS